MKPKARIRVVAGVALRDGFFLAALRPAGKPYAGRWEFPGGKVETGETDEEALRREIREELGVETTIGEEVGAHDHAYPEKTVELHFYRILDWAGEPEALGVAAIRWLDPEQARSDEFLEGDAEFLGKLADPAFRARCFS